MWIVVTPAIGQRDYAWKRTGDALYDQGAFPEAEMAYRKANEARSSAESRFNLGNTAYQQQRLDEAIAAYQAAIGQTRDPQLLADGYYNLGNAYFENQSYDQSIGAYKEALKLRPDDEAARQNLMAALRKLRQQQQQQQRQQQQQQQQDQQQQQQDQQPQPQQDQQQPQDQQQDQQPSSQAEGRPEEQPSQGPEKPLAEQEAREILKAIEREDQRVQSKLRKAPAGRTPPVKDW